MKQAQVQQGSRRGFLRGTLIAGVASGAGLIPADRIEAAPDRRPEQPARYTFLRPEEAEFISAAVDRFIPPDDEWPGAADAGVVSYIDQQMAGKWGSAGYMYWHGPFKQGTPSQGYQLPFTPADMFRRAIAAINQQCAAKGTAFHLLSPEEQDKYLRSLFESGTTLNDIPSKTFADMLLQHTLEGFFADPIYGGNKNMVGWRMLGFPGPFSDYYELMDQHGIKVDRDPVSIGAEAHKHAI